MTLERVCVFIVSIMVVVLVTGIISTFNDDGDMILGWIFSSIGFAFCLTLLLIQNGII